MIYNTTPPASLIEVKGIVTYELSRLDLDVHFDRPPGRFENRATAVMSDHEAGLTNEKTRSPHFGISWLYRFYITFYDTDGAVHATELVQRIRNVDSDCFYTNPCCPYEDYPHVEVTADPQTTRKYLLTVKVFQAI